MGGGASKSSAATKLRALKSFQEKRKSQGVNLNKVEWDTAAHGIDPEKAELSDVIACLTKFYKKHDEKKVRRVCGQVDEFIDNLGSFFRSLQRQYGEMPRILVLGSSPSRPAVEEKEYKTSDVATTQVTKESVKSNTIEKTKLIKGNSDSPGDSVAKATELSGSSADDEEKAPNVGVRSPKSRRSTIVTIADSKDGNFDIRKPENDIVERMQILKDIAAEVLTYKMPAETTECKKTTTKNKDTIVSWPDGTKYQTSPKGITVLVLPSGRVVQQTKDKIIMKRPDGTLVQRSVCDVFDGSSKGLVGRQLYFTLPNAISVSFSLCMHARTSHTFFFCLITLLTMHMHIHTNMIKTFEYMQIYNQSKE